MNRQATKWFFMAAIVITAAAVAALSRAAEVNLNLSDAWARPTLGAGRTSAAYVTVTNMGSADDRLVAAGLPGAASVEIHTAGMENGVMRMRRLEGVDIPAGESVRFAPGGLHIMIIGLEDPLVEGDTVPLTLVFEEAGKFTVQTVVTMTPPPAQDTSPHTSDEMPGMPSGDMPDHGDMMHDGDEMMMDGDEMMMDGGEMMDHGGH